MTGAPEGGILLDTVFKPWLKNFINLIYPLSCLLCKVRLNPLGDKPFCEGCWAKIELILPPFCRVCGMHLPTKNQNQALACRNCQTASYFFSTARAVCRYDGIIKECIRLFKYKSKLSIAKPLSRLMIDFGRNFLTMEDIDLILPVPLHGSKLRLRQFNQAQLLAKSLSKAFSKELQTRSLIKIRPGPAQVNLKRRERLKNVQGTFKVRNSPVLKNKNILLVDDVLTSAATANECAKVLLEAGANRVDVFTLARGV